MVNVFCISTTEGAEGVQTDEFCPQLAPFAIIAALGSRGAFPVVPGFPFALTVDLASAKLICRNDGTAGTKARRAGHQSSDRPVKISSGVVPRSSSSLRMDSAPLISTPTGKMPAQPFLLPAWRLNRARVQRRINSAVNKAIREASQ